MHIFALLFPSLSVPASAMRKRPARTTHTLSYNSRSLRSAHYTIQFGQLMPIGFQFNQRTIVVVGS